MSEKTPKVSETKVKDPNFIRFSKLQRNYLCDVRDRQVKEVNEVMNSIYEELGITEKVSKALPGTYVLRQDCSGVDVLPIEPSGKDN